MKQFGRLVFVAVFVGAIFGTAPGPAVAASTAPVVIKQCFITPPRPLSKNASGTQIDYMLLGHKTASQVTFLVGYRNAAQYFLRRITDHGTFSPGSLIQHHFALFNDVTYAGKHVQSCVPTQVRWSDATVWSVPAH